jgi:hypothetical protein
MGRPVAGGVSGDDGGEVYCVENDAAHGRYVLCVPEAFPEDAGLYTVRAQVPAGVTGAAAGAMVEASAILTVRGTLFYFVGSSELYLVYVDDTFEDI